MSDDGSNKRTLDFGHRLVRMHRICPDLAVLARHPLAEAMVDQEAQEKYEDILFGLWERKN